ncbi:MAG: MlaD family protein [Tepidisphaeraceae bacterium]|jgi:phospholipid/cholesterol/gamma-HCH transport system substrate-binding protein
MPSYQRNVLVGVTVLGALIAFGWMALKFSSRTAELFAPPQMPVHFTTPRADGLSPGSAVEYLGVEIGRVTTMNRNPDGIGVTVDAVVDRDPPLPENVRAVVISTNALGGTAIISLDVGDESPRGALVANEIIPTKYVGLQLNLFPSTLSQTAAQIGAMSEEIRLTAKKLRESGAIDDLDKTIKSFSIQAGKIGQLADSLQSVFGDSTTQSNLKVAINNLRTTTDKLDALADSLQSASANASVAIKGAGKDIDDLSKQIGDRLTQVSSVLTSMQSILDKVDKGQGAAGQLVNDPRLYQSLVDTSRQLNATVADLKRLVEQWEEEGVDLHLK